MYVCILINVIPELVKSKVVGVKHKNMSLLKQMQARIIVN